MLSFIKGGLCHTVASQWQRHWLYAAYVMNKSMEELNWGILFQEISNLLWNSYPNSQMSQYNAYWNLTDKTKIQYKTVTFIETLCLRKTLSVNLWHTSIHSHKHILTPTHTHTHKENIKIHPKTLTKQSSVLCIRARPSVFSSPQHFPMLPSDDVVVSVFFISLGILPYAPY